jgi:hypothetical protein
VTVPPRAVAPAATPWSGSISTDPVQAAVTTLST